MAERKRYITVRVPFLRSDIRVLGEVEALNDKTMKLDMTRRMRGKGLTLVLRIVNKDGKLYAFPNNMELSKSYIRRMMRKRTDYVEDSFKAKTLDLNVTIKPFLITRKKVSRAVRRNLRNTAKEFLLEYIKDRDYYTICQELVDGILQKAMLPRLKKVYPLSFCDLRVFETKEIKNMNFDKVISSVGEDLAVQDEQEVEEDGEILEESKEETEEEEEEKPTKKKSSKKEE